jgi:hypothetical protein
MSHESAPSVGGSVTLIFYESDLTKIYNEPFLNIVAAAAQGSSKTHVELAIGNSHGSNNEMCNVCRIFNDDVGVELTSRTGRNPQYSYLSLGCSQAAERRMLAYAASLVGRPFSGLAMARSLIYPRTTDGKSFFCAELVASVLQKGGLLSASSNPGAATPESLYKMYRCAAAMHGNPYTLRNVAATAVRRQARGADPRYASRLRGNNTETGQRRMLLLG